MRFPVIVLCSFLIAGSGAAVFADHLHILAESPLGVRLGSLYLLNDPLAVADARLRIDQAGVQALAKAFGPALERDPASAGRWCDVGEAMLGAGDRVGAEYCYLRAEKLAPLDLQILLNAGDFFAAVGKPLPALQRLARLLSRRGAPKDDVLTRNVFNYYENLHVIRNHLLDQAIPDQANSRAYLRYLEAGSDAAAVREVWNWCVSKGFDDESTTDSYVDFMFRKHLFDEAEAGWTRHFAGREDAYPGSSRIFNGGFEHEFAGSVLDWRFDGYAGINVARDAAVHREGRDSVRLDFSGNDNPDFHHFGETVFVRTGRYHFQAWARTAGITSDEGIRFVIVSAQSAARVSAETDSLNGTHGWTLLTADFSIPPGVTVLEIRAARRRSFRIDNQLTGTAWLDAVQLTRAE